MRTRILRWAAAVLAATAVLAGVGAGLPAATATERGGGWDHDRRDELPLVIGHRGASGYRPEHTLASYQLAIDMGADFIEPDLVSTSDGVLVARHENEISQTTDVEAHPEFAGRRSTRVIDGVELTGWFTEDFTLEELRTLRAEERIPDIRADNTAFNGLYQIPTLQEVIDLAQAEGVGIYPETKHPTYFDSIGLSLEEPLVATLRANGYRSRRDPVFIQSFETSNLRDLDRMTRVRLVQLTSDVGAPYDLVAAGDPRTYADLTTPEGLEEIAEYADGIGPSKNQVIPRDAGGNLLAPTSLVEDAHDAGLLVHPYTFRNENTFLPADLRAGDPASPLYPVTTGDAPGEYAAFFATGIDGLFSDNPDTAVAARTQLRPGGRR